MVWSHLKVLWYGEANSAKDKKKELEEAENNRRVGKTTLKNGNDCGWEIS